MSSIEGDISDIMVSNESINMKINNYEAENIELKAKCDELKRTGKLLYFKMLSSIFSSILLSFSDQSNLKN